jgi:hypothetical protein
LNEDDELMGLRFQQPEGAPSGFEVGLFIARNNGLDGSFLPLINEIME